MLYAAFVCLIISIIAGALGFTGVAKASAGIAKVIFGLFLILFIGLLVIALLAFS